MIQKKHQQWLPRAGLQEMTGKEREGTFQGGDNLP